VNPFEFYGFSDEGKLLQLNAGLKNAIGKVSTNLNNGYNKILEIQEEVKNLKKELKQWDTEGC
jgi:archaellum component FlaC